MTEPANLIELLREAVFDVVAVHFPSEVEALPALWQWWLANRDRPSDVPAFTRTGLPAIGTGGDDLYSGLLILAFSAVISEWPAGDSLPRPEAVQDALRAAAPRLGLRGARLDRVIRSSSDKLGAVLSRIERPMVLRHPRPSTPDALWVEELRGHVRHPVQNVAVDQHNGLASGLDFDLIIDEHRTRLRGRKGWKPFSDYQPRELVAVWLALRHTGGSFGRDEIEAVRWFGGEDDSGRRRFPSMARRAFMGLFGKEVLGRGRHDRYHVPVEGWSWRWIRLSEDPAESRLIRPPANPRA